jgi:flagellar hook assembly protein FlgD
VPLLSRKLLVIAVLAALVSAAAASAATRSHARTRQISVSTTELLPGVTYRREVDLTRSGPVVLDVVTMPKPDGTTYSLAPVLSNESLRGTEKLTHIGKRLESAATTVAIDGDYLSGKTKAPSGILMRGGALDTEPNPGRSSLGIGEDGSLEIAKTAYSGTWQGSAGLRPVRLNPDKPLGKFVLYTPSFGPATPPESGVSEIVFSSFPAARPGQLLDGTVAAVTNAGSTPIPRAGAVLVGRGSVHAAQLREEAPVGAQVEIKLTLTPDWSGLASALGGGPLLVSGGRAVFPDGESFPSGALNAREARGAVGELSHGRIVFVTVEGGGPAYSVGLSSYELALELVKLGATTAIGLGSGDPAGLAFNGSLLTRPSSGKEKGIADALVLSYRGVYAAMPAAAVLSPNGDGVAETQKLGYKVVRPSTVTATLSGPGETTVQLLPGTAEPPGAHSLTWDGRVNGALAPEGDWTLTVTATDDDDVTTTAQRTFSLDDTLGSLAVVRGRGGWPTATFRLSRPASVAVRVERRNGVPLATVRTAQLGAGSHRVTWQGRIGGTRAAAGRYRMLVQATSPIGVSSLVAAFSLPSHRHK